MTKPKSSPASAAAVAAHLFLSERRFRQLVDAGVFARAPRAGYDADDCRRRYIEHLRQAAAGRNATGPLDPAQQKARKDKELADRAAMQNEKLRAELVRVDDAARIVTSMFTVVRTRLLAIPSKMAGRMPAQLRTQVNAIADDEIHEALEQLSTGEDVVAAAGGVTKRD